MRALPFLLAFGVVPSSPPPPPSTPPQVVIKGVVTTSDGEHPAWFALICTRGEGAALSLQLRLADTQVSDFDFSAYEGPGARASRQPSAHLQVDQLKPPAVAVSGWYGGDADQDPVPFVFGIATTPGTPGTATAIAAALGHPGAVLTWAQNNPGPQGPPLVARFAPDATESRQITAVAAPCLPRRPGLRM
ncbi:MAG: hypothetical protein WA777_12100 [Rhodanobacter sp.]